MLQVFPTNLCLRLKVFEFRDALISLGGEVVAFDLVHKKIAVAFDQNPWSNGCRIFTKVPVDVDPML
ncbi:hypothetical protein Bca4012_092335 [Brassica carinata]